MRLRCARCGCYVRAITYYPGSVSLLRVAPCARCLRSAERTAVRSYRQVQRTIRVLRGEGE